MSDVVEISDSQPLVKKRKTRDERNADSRAKTASRKIKTNLSRRGSKGATLKTIHAAVAAMPRYSAGEQEQLLPVDDPKQIYFWSGQKVLPSKRRLLLVGGGKTPAYNHLQGGLGKLTAKVKAKNKADGTAKQKETNVERGNNVQKHHVEAEAIQAFMNIDGMNALRFKPVFDGLGADVAVQLSNTSEPDQWVAVQFKSVSYNDDRLKFNHCRREYGAVGGKYEKMPIVAIALGDVITSVPIVFDSIDERDIQELFIFSSATEFPGKVLSPYAWGLHSRPDNYGDHRWVKNRDNDAKLGGMVQRFINMIRNAHKYSLNDIYFARGVGTPNVNISPEKKKEMEQIPALAVSLMPSGFTIAAPWRQNETVDIIIRRGDWQRTVSLKSATDNKGNLQFDKSNHPRHDHCDLVIVFLYDKVGLNSHEVHVFSAHDVYVKNKRDTFNWADRDVYPVYDIRSTAFVARLTL